MQTSQRYFQTFTFPSVPQDSLYGEWPEQEPDWNKFINFNINKKTKPDWFKGDSPQAQFDGYSGMVKSRENQVRFGVGKQFYKDGTVCWGLFKDNIFVRGVVIRLHKGDSLRSPAWVNSKHTSDCLF